MQTNSSWSPGNREGKLNLTSERPDLIKKMPFKNICHAQTKLNIIRIGFSDPAGVKKKRSGEIANYENTYLTFTVEIK